MVLSSSFLKGITYVYCFYIANDSKNKDNPLAEVVTVSFPAKYLLELTLIVGVGVVP